MKRKYAHPSLEEALVENFTKEWTKHVHFFNYQEIKEYLKKHVELIDKLLIVIGIAKKHFPNSKCLNRTVDGLTV